MNKRNMLLISGMLLMVVQGLFGASGWQFPSVDLSVVGQNAAFPQIAMNGIGDAIVVWQRSNGTNTIIQAKRYISGSGWEASSTDLSLSGQNAISPQVAMDATGNAIAVWQRSNGTNTIIQAKRYIVGSGWEASVTDLSLSGQNATSPQISMDTAGNAIAVWQRSNGTNTIIQAKRYIVGSGWEASATDLSLSGQNATSPQIALDSAGNAIAVWARSNGTNIIIQAKRYIVGSGWEASAIDLSLSGQSAARPQVTIDSAGDAIAVWQRSNGVNIIIQAKRYIVGSGWEASATDLSLSGQSAQNAQVAMDSVGNATAVWQRSDGTNIIIQAKRYVNGSGWESGVTDLSLSGQDANVAQIAMDNAGNAIAVWQRSNGTNTIIQEKRYIRDSGWEVSATDLSLSGQSATAAQIAMDGEGNAIVVWSRSNGTNTIIQAIRFLAAPDMPANLKLSCSLHRFPTQADFIHLLSWDFVDGAVSYRVYDDASLENLLATVVVAENPLVALHRRKLCVPITYYVTAVDAGGTQSEPAVVSYCKPSVAVVDVA